MPIEVDGKRDGRGAGPVRVTVEGSLTKLLGHAVADPESQRRNGALTTLALPNVMFKYYVDIAWEDSKTLPGTMADVAVLSRLLDDADVPVRKGQLVNALVAKPRSDGVSADFRARYAIWFLKKAGLIRAVMVGGQTAGWIWNDRDIEDEEWRRRAKLPTSPPPIGVTRTFAPDAFAVVIGETRRLADDI
jgi:hypothetical protein